MRLGLDFDNTLVSYDRLFLQVAVEKSLVPARTPARKNAVRDHLRAAGREEDWTRLQGEVYGSRILEAEPFDGMLAALKWLAGRKVTMCIVSHKTRTPYLGEACDLHAAALGWLDSQGFHDLDGLAWPRNQVYFELSREAKIERILSQGCTHFVDDLPEVLELLPDSVEKIFFSPDDAAARHPAWRVMHAWRELPALLGLS
jgi:FMN phosphatase YigB (HAD superfamily)